MQKVYDFIIIGSGYGGLTAATLLAREGLSTLLLESHTVVGGCASYFKRKEFSFDVGATTFSGLLDNQPLGSLFNKLGLKPKLKKLDVGMVICQDGKEIIRYADRDQWIEEIKRNFEPKGQDSFWRDIYRINDLSWDLLAQNQKLMPRTIKDWLELCKIPGLFGNIKGLSLVPGLFLPFKFLMDKYGLSKDKSFCDFINEQLLITTQSTLDESPYLSSALGLAYPSEVYYPYGGIVKAAEEIKDIYDSSGGEIKFKEKLTQINQLSDSTYELETEKGNKYLTRGIISNIPIWNMEKVTNRQIKKYFGAYSKNFDNSVGAFTVYFAVKSKAPIKSAYYQIHAKEIPHCSAGSFFVTFSLDDDYEKAPEGWRTVTISTHTKVDEWTGLTKEEYEQRKNQAAQYILNKLYEIFPDFETAEKQFMNIGTPVTFEFFTQRESGSVGGIAHSVNKNFLSFVPNELPFKNFYLVGDTTFPGQGIPSVVYSATSAVNKITR